MATLSPPSDMSYDQNCGKIKAWRKEYAGICIHTTPTVLLLFYLLLMLAGLNKGLCGLMEDTGPAFFSNVQVLLNVPLYVLYALYRSSKREHRILWESRKFLLYLATGWFVKSIVKLKGLRCDATGTLWRCLKREAVGDLMVVPIDKSKTFKIYSQCDIKFLGEAVRVKGYSALVCKTCNTLWKYGVNFAFCLERFIVQEKWKTVDNPGPHKRSTQALYVMNFFALYNADFVSVVCKRAIDNRIMLNYPKLWNRDRAAALNFKHIMI
ncbi:hypothetical protein BCV71DRAFT_287056 [Rhizopus microsporus]|uniref:Uncharacterized protein n=1 Tax=Rhizopus microsporus TaxID=58291 RepID=A0A1X0RZN8_RHIZD|nr:hypothetical protein BCV71DRAFT_287056 [Rhizopus microsporus]